MNEKEIDNISKKEIISKVDKIKINHSKYQAEQLSNISQSLSSIDNTLKFFKILAITLIIIAVCLYFFYWIKIDNAVDQINSNSNIIIKLSKYFLQH